MKRKQFRAMYRLSPVEAVPQTTKATVFSSTVMVWCCMTLGGCEESASPNPQRTEKSVEPVSTQAPAVASSATPVEAPADSAQVIDTPDPYSAPLTATTSKKPGYVVLWVFGTALEAPIPIFGAYRLETQRMTSGDGRATLSFDRLPKLDAENALQEALVEAAVRERSVTLKRTEAGGFVLSGFEGDKIYYDKAIPAAEGLVRFSIVFPAIAKDKYAPHIGLIAQSFRVEEPSYVPGQARSCPTPKEWDNRVRGWARRNQEPCSRTDSIPGYYLRISLNEGRERSLRAVDEAWKQYVADYLDSSEPCPAASVMVYFDPAEEHGAGLLFTQKPAAWQRIIQEKPEWRLLGANDKPVVEPVCFFEASESRRPSGWTKTDTETSQLAEEQVMIEAEQAPAEVERKARKAASIEDCDFCTEDQRKSDPLGPSFRDPGRKKATGGKFSNRGSKIDLD